MEYNYRYKLKYYHIASNFFNQYYVHIGVSIQFSSVYAIFKAYKSQILEV